MKQLPWWSMLPFGAVLLIIAVVPALFHNFWLRYRGMLLATLSFPILIMMAAINYHWVIHAFVDYVSFICLLGALYTIGAGLLVSGTPKANPVTNLLYMVFGALLANIIGTLGASMLLIRPLLRSNRGRKHEIHVIVFFIFIVSNVGGLLTPLGDPPLFLGYLMGVPFKWTLNLFPVWMFTLTCLLGIFAALDSYFFVKDPDFKGPMKSEIKEPLRIHGKMNLLLAPIVAFSLVGPQMVNIPETWRVAIRVSLLVIVMYVSRKITPKQVDAGNRFTWEPLNEVVVIFAGIFATMIPAIHYLEINASSLGITSPWSFYWYTGLLSGVLDNAPTYAAFFAIAQGLGRDAVNVLLHNDGIISHASLAAISCGSVFFGALTYVGNGPNLLVKAVAEEEGLKMPGFFTYIIWSFIFLLPILFMTGLLFFESN